MPVGARKIVAAARGRVGEARKAYVEQVRRESKQLVDALQAELEVETKKGNLDGALAIRDQIQQIREGALVEWTEINPDDLVDPDDAEADDDEALVPTLPTIRSFLWSDRQSEDKVPRDGRVRPGDGPDLHFEVVLTLPASTIVREVGLTPTNGRGFDGWTTRPEPFRWIVGVFEDDQAVTTTQVTELGKFSGRTRFDLYIQPGNDYPPGTEFVVRIVAVARGKEHIMLATCKVGGETKGRRSSR
jgi:hypothetical protein